MASSSAPPLDCFGTPKQTKLLPRLAYTKTEAAEVLGVSLDFLNSHVLAELRVVHRGRKCLIPHGELERWLDRSAEALP